MANLLSSLLSLLRRLIRGGDASASPVSPPIKPLPLPKPAPSKPSVPEHGDVEVLGLFADAVGEKVWDYLDPARWNLYVRVKGKKAGEVVVGFRVWNLAETWSRIEPPIRTLTVGEDMPIDAISSFTMEFPGYDAFTRDGEHRVDVLLGHWDQARRPVWTRAKKFCVTVVKA